MDHETEFCQDWMSSVEVGFAGSVPGVTVRVRGRLRVIVRDQCQVSGAESKLFLDVSIRSVEYMAFHHVGRKDALLFFDSLLRRTWLSRQ